MIRSTLALSAALALMALGPARAQDIRNMPAGAAPMPAKITALSGLVGRWISSEGEADFSQPVGGQIVGHVALTDEKGAPRVEELWIFRPDGASLTLHQKIFDGSLGERLEKDKFQNRRLITIEGGRIFLEGMTLTPKGDTLEANIHRMPPLDDIHSILYKRVK